ncbi:MAG: hypothetical protein M3Y70_00350 [Pseudomonadota bacterium]|nr:hypothetical protein [Pseudomonadota bacterium]
MQDSAHFPPTNRLPAEALTWAGIAACAGGIVATGLWREIPLGRFGESLLLAAMAALLAWPLRRWRCWPWASALALAWMLLLVALTGPMPMLAVALLCAAAMALGGLAVGESRPLLACLCGLAVIAAIVGWTLALRVHHAVVHGLLLIALVGWRRRSLGRQLADCRAGWRQAIAASPRAAALGVLALGIASTGAWLPTLQYDDLAYHLGLPWQLMQHGRYALDPSQQVWALAPWAGDALQAVAQVIAREEARPALNVAWLGVTAGGLWRLGALLGLQAPARWATLALFASLPMTATLLGGMQTETAAAAVTVWLAAVILDDGDREPRRLVAGALLFGLLCALKPLHAIAALPLLVWAACRHRRALPRPNAMLAALTLVLLVGGSSYLQSWLVSGNPVLPLLNDVFASPWFPQTGFNDARWQQGFGLDIAWRLTFHTSDYLESWNGGIGLVLVALAGAWLLALSDRHTRALAWCATLGLALVLLPLQYARYLHPAMVLLLPALALVVQRWLPPRRGLVLLAAVCVANVSLQANAGWLLHQGGPKRALLSLGEDTAAFERFAPERALVAAIREQAPDTGAVLLLSQPFHAELAGRGRTVEWYAPRMRAAALAANADASGVAWEALLLEAGIAEVIFDPARLNAAQRAGLTRTGAHREREINGIEWWRVPAQGGAP